MQLGKTWTQTWHVGLPLCEDTPGNINVPVILWLRNLALAYDMWDYARWRYNHLKTRDPWFPGNTAEQLASIDLSACLAHSPHADTIPSILKECHQLLNDEQIPTATSENVSIV